MDIELPGRLIGWLSLLLLAVVVGLPYLRGNGTVTHIMRRPMAFHYWFAPLVLIGSLVHAWMPMASHQMPKTSFNGLWIATVALGMLLLQILLGVALRYRGDGPAAWLRRTHWFVMVGVAALVAIHVWMNNLVLLSGH